MRWLNCALNPRGTKLGLLTDEERRTTLHVLPETPYRVRKTERDVRAFRIGMSGGMKIPVLGLREKARTGSEGDPLMNGTRASESMDMAPEVHLGGGAGSGWLPGV